MSRNPVDNVSTLTVIGVSNCKISLETVFKSINNFDILLGCKSPWGIKGNPKSFLKKSKSLRCSSINAVIIDVQILPAKIINIKVYSNGKFHITGVRDVHQAELGIFEIFKAIPKETYEIIPPESKVVIYFKTVMKNINFDIGFCVRREKVDEFFHDSTDFVTSFESSINSGVTLKYPLKDDNEIMTEVITIDPNLKFYFEEKIPTEEKKLELTFGKSEKFHSFRVFRSGKVIFSSRGKEFEEVFNLFMKIMNENKEILKEPEP
jgi:TATA-box binding protein (TBP) (component of TFIID and TFIIIB)